MYNESYHPLEGERLTDILDGMTEDEQKIALEQVNAATAAKTRNYRVTISPATETYDGMWFDVTNGIVTGSSDLGRK
jgi:hypothetical protein